MALRMTVRLKKWQAIESTYSQALSKLYQTSINKSSQQEGGAHGAVGVNDIVAVLFDDINAIGKMIHQALLMFVKSRSGR